MFGIKLEVVYENSIEKLSRNVIKRTFWRVTNNDSNQPVHPHSLISLLCPHEETLHPWLSKNAPSEDSDQKVWMRRLIRIFAGRTYSKVRLLTFWLKRSLPQTFEAQSLEEVIRFHFPKIAFVPRLFEEKRGDMVFGLPWCVKSDAWCVVPSL